MRIVLIGAGRLATNLGVALKKAGHEVACVWSRTEASASSLASILDTIWTCQLEELPTDADVYLLSVTDQALQEVIGKLPNTNSVYIHTAGSMPMQLFEGKMLHYGVFYPMQTFSKEKRVSFEQIPCFIEGSDQPTLDVIKTLANSLSRKVYELTSEQRQYLHLGSVFACNFANHCYAVAFSILKQHGIKPEVLLPLIRETADKVERIEPLKGQTGPAVRGDFNVMQHHLQLLEGQTMWQQLYNEISEDIQRMQKTEAEL